MRVRSEEYKEKDRIRSASYYALHKDEQNARKRARYRTNAKAQAEQKNRVRRWHANTRAAAFGIEGRLTCADIAEVLAVGRCAYCGCTFEDESPHLDHVLPMAAQGPNTKANLQVLCAKDHLAKHTYDIRLIAHLKRSGMTMTYLPTGRS